MEKYADLTALTLVILIALSFGLLMTRLKQPAIVGYIIAGFALGPTGLGMVENTEIVQLLADLAVMMLLFVIGMELSLRSFKNVIGVAVGTACLQIGLSTATALGLAYLFDFTVAQAILAGFIMAVSSTAVVIKILDDVGELRTELGRTAVGVLIAQDLAIVPMLLIIADLGKGTFDPTILLKLGAAGLILALVIWFLSRRERIKIPFTEAIEKRKDMVPIAALAACFGVATVSGLVGMSAAYGAFLAGLILGNSNVRSQIWDSIKPIETCLLLVFFLSIGLLIDLPFIQENWSLVLGCLLAVTLFKTFINVLALRLLGKCWGQAFTAGALLGQVGEFSFVLAAAGLTAGIIDQNGYALAIAVIALSLLISPLWKMVAQRAHDFAATGVTNLRVFTAIIFCDEIDAVGRCANAVRGESNAKAADESTLVGLATKLRQARQNAGLPGTPVAGQTPSANAADAPS
ncbi:MAG: cation:proton antiporter [Alphaproteobacteria bacterium]|nr:cation:proton antiporter [Alphaproteobacteria bacterium SS10]